MDGSRDTGDTDNAEKLSIHFNKDLINIITLMTL